MEGPKKVNVLLVDDSEESLVIIRHVFQQSSFVNVLDTVKDGEEALKYLRQEAPYENKQRPDLVLLDINMPRKGGFEVLDEMKQHPELSSIPVVMLTTSDRSEDVARSYSKGASSFITKPFEFRRFVEMANEFSTYWSQVSRVPPNSVN